MKLQFNKIYFFSFIGLLFIETAIALFLTNGFLRSTFGDYLVVILIYCFVKSIANARSKYIAISVLVLACTIEFSQLFNFLELLNLKGNKMASLVLGSTFHVSDLIAYTLGVATILIIEYKIWRLVFKNISI